jgi:type IV secretion system protein VirB10
MAALTIAAGAAAQQGTEVSVQPRDLKRSESAPPQPAETAPTALITLAAGTKIPLVLRQAISTKNAQVGDAVYAQTNFPVAQDDRIVVPSGTYVQGAISEIRRAGRIKGRAEVLFHFTTMIFPSGYTIILPGSVENVPGAQHATVKGPEGTVQQDGQKGKEAGTIATTAGTGAAIGGLATDSVKGAGIGAGLGGATGLAVALLTRDKDVRLGNGTAVEMVLSRPLTLDLKKVRRQPAQY